MGGERKREAGQARDQVVGRGALRKTQTATHNDRRCNGAVRQLKAKSSRFGACLSGGRGGGGDGDRVGRGDSRGTGDGRAHTATKGAKSSKSTPA